MTEELTRTHSVGGVAVAHRWVWCSAPAHATRRHHKSTRIDHVAATDGGDMGNDGRFTGCHRRTVQSETKRDDFVTVLGLSHRNAIRRHATIHKLSLITHHIAQLKLARGIQSCRFVLAKTFGLA